MKWITVKYYPYLAFVLLCYVISNHVGIAIWKQLPDAVAVKEELPGLAHNYSNRRFKNGKKTTSNGFLR
jgi:hypothetical protein